MRAAGSLRHGCKNRLIAVRELLIQSRIRREAVTRDAQAKRSLTDRMFHSFRLETSCMQGPCVNHEGNAALRT